MTKERAKEIVDGLCETFPPISPYIEISNESKFYFSFSGFYDETKYFILTLSQYADEDYPALYMSSNSQLDIEFVQSTLKSLLKSGEEINIEYTKKIEVPDTINIKKD